jgi:hypothetical protein
VIVFDEEDCKGGVRVRAGCVGWCWCGRSVDDVGGREMDRRCGMGERVRRRVGGTRRVHVGKMMVDMVVAVAVVVVVMVLSL